MTTRVLNSLALLIVAAAGGCALPSPLVRLEPATRNVTWVSGRAAFQKETPVVRVATAFEQQLGNKLGFRVEIQNLRDEQLEVEPHRFSFTACHGETRESCQPTEPVIDPEQVLHIIDARASRQRAEASNAEARGTALILHSLAADVGDYRGRTHAAANRVDAQAIRYQNSQASLANSREMWANVALRRNTLLPGMGVAGDVFVPIDLKAKVVWLHVRGDGWKVSFPFYQSVTRLH
jgi:hypothetical protein